MATPQLPLDQDQLSILARHLMLARGARLLVMVCEADQVEPSLASVEARLSATSKQYTPLRLDPYATPEGYLAAVDEETLNRVVFDPLTTGEEVTRPGVLVVVDGSRGSQRDEFVWQALFARLNLARNTVMRRLGGPLLLALSPGLFRWLARGAPDLYAIRSAVVRLASEEPSPEEERPSSALRLHAPEPSELDPRVRQRAQYDLEELLLDMFSVYELRRLLRSIPDTEIFERDLPLQAPPAALASAVVSWLERRALLNAETFSVILQARPRRAAEIKSIAAQLGVDVSTIDRPGGGETAPQTREEPRVTLADTSRSAPEAVLILASYNPEEVLPGRHADLRLFLSADAEDRATWESTTWSHLRDLRQALAAQGRKRLLILPRCVVGLAIRAGAVFHRATGMDVSVVQRDDSSGRDEVWALDGESSPANVHVELRLPDRGEVPEEVHLLLSIAQDTFPLWSRWRFTHAQPAVLLHIRPPGGTSRSAVQGAPAARDLARAVTGLLLQQRAAWPSIPIRVFYAGPAGLAVALGRGLNALGDIILMDLDKYRSTYVESFRFQGG